MQNIIEVCMGNDEKLYIETSGCRLFNDDPLFVPTASESTPIKRAEDFLENSFSLIKNFSSNIAKSIINSDTCPDEFEVEFSVCFSADAGVIISSTRSESSISFRMTWNKRKEK